MSGTKEVKVQEENVSGILTSMAEVSDALFLFFYAPATIC